MMEVAPTHTSESYSNKVENYYRFHAPIYDATRWSFLFGRKRILDMIPDLPADPRIMEIGCGTGQNIRRLENQFPNANILGVDLSNEMLKIASEKLNGSDQVDLLKARYGSDQLHKGSFDMILLSYSLTMMNGLYKDLLIQVSKDLKPDGHVAVVDFHASPFDWFRRWMNLNHVDFSGHLLPQLQKHFQPIKKEVNNAYAGLWSYFLFVGEIKNRSEKEIT